MANQFDTLHRRLMENIFSLYQSRFKRTSAKLVLSTNVQGSASKSYAAFLRHISVRTLYTVEVLTYADLTQWRNRDSASAIFFKPGM